MMSYMSLMSKTMLKQYRATVCLITCCTTRKFCFSTSVSFAFQFHRAEGIRHEPCLARLRLHFEETLLVYSSDILPAIELFILSHETALVVKIDIKSPFEDRCLVCSIGDTVYDCINSTQLCSYLHKYSFNSLQFKLYSLFRTTCFIELQSPFQFLA